MQEKLEEIKKMTSIEYLNILNDKIKEKLIWTFTKQENFRCL